MRLFANKRIRDIFLLLSKGPLTQVMLSKALNVSTRTVRSDLTQLDDLLASHGCRLMHDRKAGFHLEVINESAFEQLLQQAGQQWRDVRSAAERRRMLTTLLLHQQQCVALETLESQWFVSIYSLRHDLQLLKKHFALYQLRLSSTSNDLWLLSGEEQHIRQCLYDDLIKSRESEKALNATLPVHYACAAIKKTLTVCLNQSRLYFNDMNLRFLTLACTVIVHRIRHGHLLMNFDYHDMATDYNDLAAQLLRHFLDTQAPLPESEIHYLAMHLAAFCYIDSPPFGDDTVNNIDTAIMNHLLSYIRSVWYCDVNYDTQLKRTLLNHIKAMRVRVNNAITIVNPLLGQIKRHYPLIYEMTVAACNELSGLFIRQINEDEIGYLVMHVGAALEASGNQGGPGKRSALIVSDLSDSITRIVVQKVVRMYPDITIASQMSSQRYLQLTEIKEDIVIALDEVEEKNKQVVYLPPFPDRQQLEQIKYCFARKKPRALHIRDYFSAGNFFIFPKKTHNKISLISFLARHLALRGDVGDTYLDSVMIRENFSSTLLDEKIAIPHPMGLVSCNTLIAVALFPEGIEWDEGKYVKMVCMLAIDEEAFVDSMLIYDYLTTILDDDIINKLSASRSFEQFMALSEPHFPSP